MARQTDGSSRFQGVTFFNKDSNTCSSQFPIWEISTAERCVVWWWCADNETIVIVLLSTLDNT